MDMSGARPLSSLYNAWATMSMYVTQLLTKELQIDDDVDDCSRSSTLLISPITQVFPCVRGRHRQLLTVCCAGYGRFGGTRTSASELKQILQIMEENQIPDPSRLLTGKPYSAIDSMEPDT
jgi:hypothetical protein